MICLSCLYGVMIFFHILREENYTTQCWPGNPLFYSILEDITLEWFLFRASILIRILCCIDFSTFILVRLISASTLLCVIYCVYFFASTLMRLLFCVNFKGVDCLDMVVELRVRYLDKNIKIHLKPLKHFLSFIIFTRKT